MLIVDGPFCVGLNSPHSGTSMPRGGRPPHLRGIEASFDGVEIVERLDAQGLLATGLVALRTTAVLWRAGALPAHADGVAFAFLGREPVLDADLVRPPIPHVVDVDELGVAAEPQALECHVGRSGAKLGRAVAGRADPELVEVQPFPAHGVLDDAAQLLQRRRDRHQHPPPDHRADIQQPHLHLQDRTRRSGECWARLAGHDRPRVSALLQATRPQHLRLSSRPADCGAPGIFRETGSGARADRIERRKVMALAQRREIDAVLVTELSRWGRSTLDLLHTLQELEARRVSVIAMSGLTFDLATPHGRMLATVIAGVAEFERELIRERVRSGMAAAKARGKKLGRQPGYRPKSDRLAPKVLALVALGRSYRLIGRELGLSKNTVADIVRRKRAASALS
jgi:putative DNA-invertase from lambdoid prophage Rac